MDVAIFGIGRIGKTHLRDLADEPRVHVKYLVDIKAVHDKVTKLAVELRLRDFVMLSVDETEAVFNDEK